MGIYWSCRAVQRTQGTIEEPVGSARLESLGQSHMKLLAWHGPANKPPTPRWGRAPSGRNNMAKPNEEEIKKRAHQLWEQHGKPEGREDEFWHLAEQELRNEDKSSPLRTPDSL